MLKSHLAKVLVSFCAVIFCGLVSLVIIDSLRSKEANNTVKSNSYNASEAIVLPLTEDLP